MDNMESKNKYAVVSANQKIRFQRVQGRYGRYCSVPFCSASTVYNSFISLHCFPKDQHLRSQWLARIRRKDFVITTNTRVCSRHFESGEIVISSTGRRTLSPNAVPTLFQWNNYRKSQRLRVWEHCPALFQSEEAAAEIEEGHNDTASGIEVTNCEVLQEAQEVPMAGEQDYAASSSLILVKLQCDNVIKEIEEQRQHIKSLQLTRSFGLERFSSSPEDIRFYTRFPSYEHLMAFWSFIQEASTRTVWVTAQKNLSTITSTESPVIRPTKLLPIDELFLFLNYMATGCKQQELSHKFNIHRTTVSRIIVTWANFLYTLLGSISIWMSSAAVKKNRPKEFDGAYENTQVILYCAEIKCQTPSSLLLQRDVFSIYKSHYTFKALIGMSPHGALTYVSALFEGSISDKELFHHSGIISLLTSDMDVMVDKGFLVDELVPGNVHRPAFLSKQAKLSEMDVLKTQSIACLRVHVDGLIRRVKENKLFDTIIPLSISGSINQIFTVACLLTNYQFGPLVKR